MSSYFFPQALKTKSNASLLTRLEKYAEENKILIYVLNRPLTDLKYNYKYENSLIILSPKHKIAFLNYGDNVEEFEDYVEDVIEDIGSIADKYNYRDIIGRPKKWRRLIEDTIAFEKIESIDFLLNQLIINDAQEIKTLDLLISLFIGSINDMIRVKEEVPKTTLDKVKQKIQLFDGEQTRFIYDIIDKKSISIQGLSGTGKTELLLHKLKDIYIKDNSSKIFFTCHSKVLANSLRKRIPSFFNFMKVEQQIEWDKRLWCTNSWGSGADPDSGAYSSICSFYNIQFYRYSSQMSFDKACQLAINEIKEKYKGRSIPKAYSHMFIDESQDFNEPFFELCELITEHNVFIAGDIFQSIFDARISPKIQPDYLLGKCYRTDPKTLMFAHGLGMGLFEQNKLRWLDDKEWHDCGYEVQNERGTYHLKREPLRRFEDLEDSFESIQIIEHRELLTKSVIDIIKNIYDENPTTQPGDIGIIFLDQNSNIYKQADELEIAIQKHFRFTVNKAYETKANSSNSVFVSNRYNVKGLEFPFVICITKSIITSTSYRNTLYTMLTRSFIKSFLLVPITSEAGLTEGMKLGLKRIIEENQMIINEPSESEKVKIRTRFEERLKRKPYYDSMIEILNNYNINKKDHDLFFQMAQQLDLSDSDFETLDDFVKTNMKYLKKN